MQKANYYKRKKEKEGKKMKKNNKGFTLIELLAVIVVLAIIMVIATQQINKTLKKSRGDSFYDSVLMIEKNAKMLCAQNNDSITTNDLIEASDIDDKNYTLTGENNKLTIQGKEKFNNMTLPTTLKSTVNRVKIDEKKSDDDEKNYYEDRLQLTLPDGCSFGTTTPT